MLAYVVVLASGGAPVPAALLARLRAGERGDLPFTARRHLVWSNAPQTTWVACWADGDDRPSAPGWHRSAADLVAFTGHLWPRIGGWSSDARGAEQLAHHLQQRPLWDASDDLGGVFTALSMTAHGRSAVAADPLGLGLLYWGRRQHLTVVSSRAALAAEMLAPDPTGPPEKDVHGAGWLAYCGFPIGPRTGHLGVSVVPPGGVVRIDPTGDAHIASPKAPPWCPPDGPDEAPDASALDAVREEMLTTIHMARDAAAPGGARAGLSGGRDSRVILALLLADGVAGDFQFETYGQPDLPDVAVATRLAEQLDLRHVLNPWAERVPWRLELEDRIRSYGLPGASSREIAFRLGTHVAAAARNVSDGLAMAPFAAHRPLLSGLCGEGLRTNYAITSRYRTKQDAARLPDHLGFGTAGILRPEAMAVYRTEVHELLFEGVVDTDSPQDVTDVFYLRHRLRRWFASGQETDVQGRRFPLYSLAGLRLAFAIGAENRHAQWIHRRLVQATWPGLLDLPFAGAGWSASATNDLVLPRRHDEPTPPAPPPPPAATRPADRSSGPGLRTVVRDLRARLQSADVELMRRFLCEDSANPIQELLEPGAAGAALDRFADLAEPQRVQLYGAATAAIWLGDHDVPMPGGPSA